MPAARRRRHPHPNAGRLASASGVAVRARHLQPELRRRCRRPVTSYINHSTSPIHPGSCRRSRSARKARRVYYPAPYMTNDNLSTTKTPTRSAREDHRHLRGGHPACGSRALADVVLQRHRHHPRRTRRTPGRIKTLYYIRLRQMALRAPECRGSPRVLHAVAPARQRKWRRLRGVKNVNLTFTASAWPACPGQCLQRGKVLDGQGISTPSPQ